MLVLVLESKGFFRDCRISFDHAHTFRLLPIALQTYNRWVKHVFFPLLRPFHVRLNNIVVTETIFLITKKGYIMTYQKEDI